MDFKQIGRSCVEGIRVSRDSPVAGSREHCDGSSRCTKGTGLLAVQQAVIFSGKILIRVLINLPPEEIESKICWMFCH